MQDTRYVLTERAECVMEMLDRLLAMPPEDRLDLAHDLHCASTYLMTGEDDMEGATCLIDALQRLVAVSPVQIGGGNAN